MNRRTFTTTMLAGAAAGLGLGARPFKVVRLFKSPDGYPNGLEADKRGLWVCEQMTDMAYLMDMNGKVLHSVQTECANASGIAYGDGYLWLASNGKPIRRAPKAWDNDWSKYGVPVAGGIIKTDPETGKCVARYAMPGGKPSTSCHGLEFAEGTLWITSLSLNMLTQVDPKDFRVIKQIPVHLQRSHGLAWDPPGIWCVHTTDRVIHKLDPSDGRILDQLAISKDDPEPHGLCIREGKFYYSDSFIEKTGSPKPDTAGWICRIDFT